MSLPDAEVHFKAVQQLAEEARTNAAQPTPVDINPQGKRDSVAAPIHLGKPTDFIPESYVLHYSETCCTACGTKSRRSHFYALNYLRSRTGASRVKNLTPCARPLYNLPVTRLFTGRVVVPYCGECETIDLSHLPPPPSPAQLHDLPDARLKGQPARPASDKPKPTPKKSTLEDLI